MIRLSVDWSRLSIVCSGVRRYSVVSGGVIATFGPPASSPAAVTDSDQNTDDADGES